MAVNANGPGARGGWGFRRPLTRNLMEDPQPQRSLMAELVGGYMQAVQHKVHAGPEYRNYTRANRLPSRAEHIIK